MRYQAALTFGLLLLAMDLREAAAQRNTTFEQLPPLLRPGETVVVTDGAGIPAKGGSCKTAKLSVVYYCSGAL